MSDVLFLALTVAFFAIALGLIRGCDAILAGSRDPDPDEVVDVGGDVLDPRGS
jgi:hypothetical protein